MKTLLSVGVCCSILFGFGHGPSVLVTVELRDNAEIAKWLAASIPTYEFIDNAAIAEVGPAEMERVAALGFTVRVIDETPWTGQYFFSEFPVDLESQIPGDILWRRGEIVLIRAGDEKIPDLRRLPLQFQPLKRRSLPLRFWQQVMSKMVVQTVEWDPFIQSVVDQVNTDSITSYIQRLQDFKTRLALTDSSFAASAWLRQKFNSWGMAAVFDSFYMATNWPGTGYERNVIATLDGTMDPSKIMIICGHHDAIVWWDTALARYNAPGADDNASGAVAALEAARIFSNYSWEPTMQFITWGAEELGLFGSYHYAERADSLGLDIGGVLNFDMIGYMDDANLDCIIQRHASASLWLSDLFHTIGQTYVPSLAIYRVISSGGSDWYPFAIHGFPAVGGAERAGSFFNPYYHDTTDLLSTMSPALYTDIVKTGVATLAVLGLYPGPVRDVAVIDIGEGTTLHISWQSSPESDVAGYRVCWGRLSEAYSDSHFVAGIAANVDTLTGLMTDSTYYIIVRAIDAAGHPSYASYEVACTPRLVPLAPSGVVATPIASGVRIDWHPNAELDLAGYRLYRRLNDDPVYDSLNTALLTDTTYTDNGLSGANRYYYTLRAFDDAGHGSVYSAEAYGRPITLDQGVLVVDETRNATNPPDSLQDAFYAYILTNYLAAAFEYDSSHHAPVLADFVPYSSIVWFADDYLENFAAGHVADLQTYLGLGGNLWFVGWRPTANLQGQLAYPFTFSTGSFLYDYFHLSNVAITAATDSFQAADGLAGYPRLEVDTSKVPYSTWNGVLRYIEALTPVSGGEVIYTMDMRNSASPYQGASCAVRYLGSGHKAVFFGFPLYFMDQDDARLAAQQVMSDFGEVGIAETPKSTGAVSGVLLQPNVPNPFKNETVLRYQLGAASNVRLRIYNVVGQSVSTLVDAVQEPGAYSIIWPGLDDHGRKVASGVYFCRLETENESTMKKLTILR
ncbi:M28 family peptidase [candidate division WOR-3 bacterium]|nr:M28 family peptidase [candidate division WOR-3 bacterium]